MGQRCVPVTWTGTPGRGVRQRRWLGRWSARVAVAWCGLIVMAALAGAQEAEVRALLDRAAAGLQSDPGEAASAAARALELARAQGLPGLVAEALFRRGQALSAGGDNVAAIVALREAVALMESSGNRPEAHLVAALHLLGQLLGSASRDGEAVPVLRRAVEEARQAKDEGAAAAATTSLAWGHFRLGRYDEALEQALAGLRYLEDRGDRGQEANVRLLIGFVHRNMSHWEEALAFFAGAERLAREIEAPVLAVRALNEQGNVLQLSGRPTEALPLHRAALAQARATGDGVVIASCANDLGGTYFVLERYDDALALFLEAYSLHLRLGSTREAGLGATNVAALHLALGRRDEALRWAREGLRIIQPTGRAPDEEVARATLALVLAERGEAAGAYEQLKAAYELRERIASDETARRMADLAALYEADRREAEIAILTRDRAIQRLELDRERKQRTLILGGLTASGVLAGLLALGYRSKLRTNRIITLANAELTTARDQLDRLSRTDALTGLANRRHVDEKLAEEVLRHQRRGDEFTVVLADLDHFKRINDQYGHPAGDAVLVHAAEVLRGGVRTLDTVGRWGGEEFILVLPLTGIDGACAVAEKIRIALAGGTIQFGDVALSVSATFGAAAYSGGELGDTLRRADDALYRGKQAGRNRVERAE